MLTAIRAWTEGLMHARSQSDSLSGLLAAAHPKLSEAVRHTPDELAALKEAGVVDAGAKGFAAFIEGFRDYAAGRLSETDLAAEGDAELPPIDRSEEPAAAPPDLRYCCEFLLRARTGETLDPQAIRTLLERYGDSVIVAGGGKAARAHIHGDDPGQLAALLSRVAVIEDQKVDDMALQYLDAHERLSDVAILTDSACDLSSELVLGHRIHVVPLSVNFGEEAYLDKLTMTPARFYEEAESSRTFPTSSQPSAQRFRRVYEALAARYSSIIAIHLSASMSGTFEASAREADAVARNGRTRIDVYDSRHLSGSLGLIVLKAAEMAAAGASHDDILAALPGLSLSAENLVSVRTLDYMVRGGRVSPLKGALAKALNLKPIVSVDKRGKSVLYGKSFRIRNNESKIIAMAKAMAAERGIGRWAVVHAHAEREAKDFAARMESALGSAPAYLCEVSCIVGLNSGRGAVSFVCL